MRPNSQLILRALFILICLAQTRQIIEIVEEIKSKFKNESLKREFTVLPTQETKKFDVQF